jgi:hypothetical protein
MVVAPQAGRSAQTGQYVHRGERISGNARAPPHHTSTITRRLIMFNVGNGINIVVAPQINVQVALNLAVLSPGAVQVIGQNAGNGLGAVQGRR